MIKGLAITPPILGRISIGRVVENNGKRLPQKDDQFTITTQVQTRDGWLNHPIDEKLRSSSKNDKLRSIPVRLLFNDPDLNLRAEYSLFDRKNGRPLCAGNGDTCRRHTQAGIETLPCPSPDNCEYGTGGLCKPYGRLNMVIEGDDELGTFVFRTTGFNSIRCIAARLSYYHAVSGGLLACMPLELRIRGKSTTQSHRSVIYYVDLTVREGMSLEEAITEARQTDYRRREAGHDQEALDNAACKGFENADFEYSEGDIPEIVEEFYPDIGETSTTNTGKSENKQVRSFSKPSLKDKLNNNSAVSK